MADRRPTQRSHYGWLLVVLAAPLALLIILPPAALLAHVSPNLMATYLTTPPVAQAVELSLSTSAASVAVTILFGTPLAYVLGRRRFPGRIMLEVLVDWPIVLPPAAAGIALLLTLGQRGILGRYLAQVGMTIPFTPIAVIIAQTFVACPYYIRAASSGFAAVDGDFLEAASLDGAWPVTRFIYVTVPLAAPSLAAGAALAGSRALGEFGATIIFAGNMPGKTQTMPLLIYMGFNIDLAQAIALGAVLMVVSFALLLAIRLTHWRLTAFQTRRQRVD